MGELNVLAPLPIALPMAGAALVTALTRFVPRWLQDIFTILIGIAVTWICAALFARCGNGPSIYWFGEWVPKGTQAIGIAFVIDRLSTGLCLLASLLATGAMIYSARYFKSIGDSYDSLLLLFLAAMLGFSLSGDIFNLFVFFELMGITAFALTGCKSEEQGPVQGSLNFAIINSLGAFSTLLGIGLLYATTGALNLAQIGAVLSDAAHRPDPILVSVAFLLFVSGFLVKAAIFPFHFWLSDAHAVAPAPICTLFSGVMAPLGLYALLRVYWVAFSHAFADQGAALRMLLIFLGSLTTLIGAVQSYLQLHIKRLLAFSTISHLGVILIAISLLDPEAISGAVIYLFSHALTKASLFFLVGNLLHLRGKINEKALFGRAKDLYGTGLLFLVSGIALTGAPGFALYLGKIQIEDAARSQGYHWLLIVTTLGSVLTSAAVFRVYLRVFLGWGAFGADTHEKGDRSEDIEKEAETELKRTPPLLFLPPLIWVIASAGLAWTPWLNKWGALCAQILVPHSIVAPKHSDPSDVKVAIACLLAAVALAFFEAFKPRLPSGALKFLKGASDPFTHAIRKLHSGHVGDYVTWYMSGVAGMLVWLGIHTH